MELHREEPGLPPETEGAEGQSPEHQLYLQSSWDLPGDVEFDLMGRYVDQITGLTPGNAPTADNVIDSYISLDVRLAWKLRQNLVLEIVGRNLLDDHHPEFGTSPFFRSETAEIERSVYGTVKWQF
jgi:iron complex outermembrane receptor protein